MNIHFVFKNPPDSSLNPLVTGVFNYPRKKRLLGNSITHRGWTIECHAREAGRVQIGDGKRHWFKRAAGMVHIYMPGTIFREDTRKAALPVQEAYIGFRWEGDCALKRLMHPDLKFASILDKEDRIGDLMREASNLCLLSGEEAFWQTQSMLMQMSNLLLKSTSLSPGRWALTTSDAPTTSSFSEAVEQYMRTNISRKLNIADIAAHMRVSASSLNHKFKAETGTAPLTRFSAMRLDAVKQLLRKGRRLQEIADMLDYCDEFYLSNIFKKQTGISPRQFKRSGSSVESVGR